MTPPSRTTGFLLALLVAGASSARAGSRPEPGPGIIPAPRPGIIATVGPASSGETTLRQMIRHGMGVARINLAHGDARATRRITELVRGASQAEGRPVLLLCDLPGGKVRTGSSSSPVLLEAQQPFDLTVGRSQPTTRQGAHVTYRALPRHVAPGDHLLLDDGRLELEVTEVADARVRTRVLRGGSLRSRSGLTVAGKELPFPAITPRDRRKLAVAVAGGADFVGVSMVQGPHNIRAVRRALHRLGADRVKVVAKVESLAALANLDAIIDAADAVMIARGDLQLAVGAGGLAAAQESIAARCRARGKPFITATGLMSRMIDHPEPSRANLLDVRRSSSQGPSYLMLNETAIGRYPVETVKALSRALEGRQR